MAKKTKKSRSAQDRHSHLDYTPLDINNSVIINEDDE
jgi:hypothetical protein